MGAKFRYVGVESKDVTTPEGVFTAEPDHVYEVKGRVVAELRDTHDFVRVAATEPAEEPTWRSPS